MLGIGIKLMTVAIGGIARRAPSFELNLMGGSIIPARGSVSPTFTRATVAFVEDWESLLKSCLSGEARFRGMRRVRNLCPTPSTSIAVSGNKTITVGVGTFVFSMGAEATGTCLITFTGTATGSTGTLTANATKRTATTLTITGGGTIIATCTVAAAADVQFEEVTGQSNTNPSEYVSVGVLSSPYHGANVDGVKYFTTQNGNTVAANVVTEAVGAALTNMPRGFYREGARTNRALHSQAFDNAVWVAANVTKAANEAVAPDGTTTADTLTASAANGTVIQDLGVVASAAKAGGLWIKRKTGTGNIDLTLDGGTTWTTKAITAAWTRIQITQTLADEDFGIRIVTSGDALWVWQGQVETIGGNEPTRLTTDIATTTAAVTRNADALTFPKAGIFSDAQGSTYAEWWVDSTAGYSAPRIIGDSGGAAGAPFTANSALNAQVFDGTNGPIGVGGVVATVNKGATSWGPAGLSACTNGGTVATNVYDGGFGLANIGIGGANQLLFDTIIKVKLFSTQPPDAVLQAMTVP